MDEKRVFQTIEDNFRLMQLSSREQAQETHRLTGCFEQLAGQTEESKRIATESHGTALRALDLGRSLSRRADLMADTIDQIVAAISQLGYGTSGIRQEISELRQRVDRLEERAS